MSRQSLIRLTNVYESLLESVWGSGQHPVYFWDCSLKQYSALVIWATRYRSCPWPLIQDCSGDVVFLSRHWLSFGLSARVWWSLICGEGHDEPVGKRFSSLKPNFNWKIEETNVLWTRHWTVSSLNLSFNRIRLLILIWTTPRRFLTFREKWGDGWAVVAALSPESLQHAFDIDFEWCSLPLAHANSWL